MSWLRVALLCLCLATGPSCARTVYTNLHPHWRHFFLYGWIPGEMVIDAAAYCGGTDRIERIETRESFVQGFIAAFAGYYVNIYSPYTGRVVCDRHVKAKR